MPLRIDRFWIILGLGALITAFLVIITWANYNYLNVQEYAHRDFMSLWGGGWAILRGIDPYDPELWRPLRLELGSIWQTADQGNPFPLWTLLLMTPLSSISIGWGAAIWLTISQFILGLCTGLLLIEISELHPSLPAFALIAIGVFTFRATLVTLHNGQITIVLLAILTTFLVSYKRGKQFLSGFIFGLIILKPNPFILLAPLVALWLLYQRKWRVIAGGTTSVMMLVIISWLVQPGWLLSWATVREKTTETARTFIMPTLWGLSKELSANWAPIIGLGAVVILTIIIGWLVFVRGDLSLTEVVAVGVVGSILITPYAWVYEHVLLLMPLILIFTRISRRWLSWITWILLVLFLPWILYWVSDRYGWGTPEVILPLITAAILGFLLLSTPLSDHKTLLRQPELDVPTVNQ